MHSISHMHTHTAFPELCWSSKLCERSRNSEDKRSIRHVLGEGSACPVRLQSFEKAVGGSLGDLPPRGFPATSSAAENCPSKQNFKNLKKQTKPTNKQNPPQHPVKTTTASPNKRQKEKEKPKKLHPLSPSPTKGKGTKKNNKQINRNRKKSNKKTTTEGKQEASRRKAEEQVCREVAVSFCYGLPEAQEHPSSPGLVGSEKPCQYRPDREITKMLLLFVLKQMLSLVSPFKSLEAEGAVN